MLHASLKKSFVGPAPLLEMGTELRRGCVVESYVIIVDGEVKVLGDMFWPTGFHACDLSHQILEEFDGLGPLLFVGVGGAITMYPHLRYSGSISPSICCKSSSRDMVKTMNSK